MAIDVNALRIDTPAANDWAFLDNAGASLSPTPVNQVVREHLEREQQLGGYLAAYQQADAVADVRRAIGELVGASSTNVALSSSATSAWSRFFSSVTLRPGDRVVTTRAEYASNILPLLRARAEIGIKVVVIPDGDDGAPDVQACTQLLDERVVFVSVCHAPSQNGLLADAAGIGHAVRELCPAAWYVVDACQSVGQIPVNMDDLNADAVTATGRKYLRGPRGTGFLALSDRALELDPFPIDMNGFDWLPDDTIVRHPDASRFESFETSIAGVLGLGTAIRYAMDCGIDNLRDRINELAGSLRQSLADLEGIHVLDRGSQRSGIVVFSATSSLTGPELVNWLRTEHGVICLPVNQGANPIDWVAYDSDCVLRASVHAYNNDDDAGRLIEALEARPRS